MIQAIIAIIIQPIVLNIPIIHITTIPRRITLILTMDGGRMAGSWALASVLDPDLVTGAIITEDTTGEATGMAALSAAAFMAAVSTAAVSTAAVAAVITDPPSARGTARYSAARRHITGTATAVDPAEAPMPVLARTNRLLRITAFLLATGLAPLPASAAARSAGLRSPAPAASKLPVGAHPAAPPAARPAPHGFHPPSLYAPFYSYYACREPRDRDQLG